MANVSASINGFDANGIYTIEQIAIALNRTREWVYYTFFKPTDHTTRKRLMDQQGKPVAGVNHFCHGGMRITTGAALASWICEHAIQEID